MITVLYESAYGSTAEYATALASFFGTEAQLLADAAVDTLPAGPLVVLSYVHGPIVPAAAFVAKHDHGDRPVAVCAVGMTLIEQAREKDQMKDAVPDVARFYLPGRLSYSTMSRKHKMVMWGLVKMLKAKKQDDRSENDQAIIDAYDRDVDFVDLRELDPVKEWVNAQRSR